MGGAVWFAPGSARRAVDPSTNAADLNRNRGNTPSAIAVGEGSVWVANTGDNTIAQVNPRTASAVRPSPSAAARAGSRSGRRASGCQRGRRRRHPDRRRLGLGVDHRRRHGPTGIAYGAGAVWVANAATAPCRGSTRRPTRSSRRSRSAIARWGSPSPRRRLGRGSGADRGVVLQADRGQVEDRVEDDAAGSRGDERARWRRVTRCGGRVLAMRTSSSPSSGRARPRAGRPARSAGCTSASRSSCSSAASSAVEKSIEVERPQKSARPIQPISNGSVGGPLAEDQGRGKRLTRTSSPIFRLPLRICA